MMHIPFKYTASPSRNSMRHLRPRKPQPVFTSPVKIRSVTYQDDPVPRLDIRNIRQQIRQRQFNELRIGFFIRCSHC